MGIMDNCMNDILKVKINNDKEKSSGLNVTTKGLQLNMGSGLSLGKDGINVNIGNMSFGKDGVGFKI